MSNKKPPPPTGVKPPPPERPFSKFRFHKPLHKPKKLATPPSTKENLLHIYCMTVLGVVFFIGGILYLGVRRPMTGFGSSTIVIGGLIGLAILYNLCKNED